MPFHPLKIVFVLELLFTGRSVTRPSACCQNITDNIWDLYSAPTMLPKKCAYGRQVAWLMLHRKNNDKGNNGKPESFL